MPLALHSELFFILFFVFLWKRRLTLLLLKVAVWTKWCKCSRNHRKIYDLTCQGDFTPTDSWIYLNNNRGRFYYFFLEWGTSKARIRRITWHRSLRCCVRELPHVEKYFLDLFSELQSRWLTSVKVNWLAFIYLIDNLIKGISHSLKWNWQTIDQ